MACGNCDMGNVGTEQIAGASGLCAGNVDALQMVRSVALAIASVANNSDDGNMPACKLREHFVALGDFVVDKKTCGRVDSVSPTQWQIQQNKKL